MLQRLPSGIYAMLVTPFNKDESINFGALCAEIDWCAAHGADGVVVTPSIGEFACLDDAERRTCFAQCASHVQRHHPRLRLIATTADTCLRKIRRHTEAAMDFGYDAAQVVPPYYWVPDKDEVFRHFSEVAAMGLPIVVYHNPKLSKVNISPEFAGRLVRIPGVVGMKEVKTDRQAHLEPLFMEVGGVVPIFTTFRAFSTGLVLGSGGGFVNVFALEAAVAMWRIFDKMGRSAVHPKIEQIQNMTNITFPRGGEDNQRHIGSTKLAASIVTGIPMGKPRAPYMYPDPGVEPPMRSNLSKLRELIAS